MNRTAFKIAASTVMVALTMTSVAAPSGAMRRNGHVRANAPSDREARQFYDQASRALQQGNLSGAVSLMERAVTASPRDVGYRMLLADAYLRSGRFDSARVTYAEAVELDPSNVRGALSVALIHIAQGRRAAAVGILDEFASRGPAADIGLAYALAGRADRAVDLLESAARSPMATARTRQNLALAYAFAGDWSRARAVAAQDISPSVVETRMAEWAQMVSPGAGPTQVATLLGVAPGADQGRPLQVALGAGEPVVPGADRIQVAEAPTPSRAQFAPAEVPVPEAAALAAAEHRPSEAPAFWAPAQAYREDAVAEAPATPLPAPAPRAVRVRPHAMQVRYDNENLSAEDGAPATVTADAPFEARSFRPVARATAARPTAQYSGPPRRAAFIRAAATNPLPQPVVPRTEVRPGSAPVVVQLGAFSNEGNAERAWQLVSDRYGLAGRQPLTTTFAYGGRTLHRVSVSGFASHGDAQRLCAQIRGEGGACFVRATAGDSSIRWAARYTDPRRQRA